MGAEAQLLLWLGRRPLEGEIPAGDGFRAADLDWDLVSSLAERHGLAPLLERHAQALAACRMTRQVRARLWARTRATATRNRAMASELVAIVRMLEEHGIATVAYKGPTLALRAYGDLSLREFGDLDLLVRASDVFRAKAILATRGYVAASPLTHAQEQALLESPRLYELALIDRERGLMVELHWRGDPEVEFPPLHEDSWWRDLERTVVDGASMHSLPDAQLLLLLCLHGTKHFWLSLGWLVDIAQLIRREPDLDWEWISATAKRHRCERRVALGLLLARELLGARIPDRPDMRVNDRAVRRAALWIRGQLFLAQPQGPSLVGALRMNAQLHDDFESAMTHVWQVVVTPGWGEWQQLRLPRRLFFLYWLLRPARLFAKYVLRLRSRESRLPPGLVDDHGDGIRQVDAAIPGAHR